MATTKLYSYFRSSASYRVRIALNLKGLPYELIPIHLLKEGGQQNTPEYKKLNPLNQLPAFIHAGNLIAQSVAIIEYIDEVQPEPALLPTNPTDKAIVRQMVEIVNSGIQPLQNIAVTQYLDKNLHTTPEQTKEWMMYWMNKGLVSLETMIDRHGGKYTFGDSLTMADCFLVPQVFASRRFGVDFAAYPKMLAIYDRCSQLEAFIQASPEKQPDFEK